MPTKKKNRHVGIAPYRLKSNPMEKKFIEAWQHQNRNGEHLAHLLNPNPENQHYPPDPSDRDCLVAATVVQWLGSPIGQIWLEGVGFMSSKRVRAESAEETKVANKQFKDGEEIVRLMHKLQKDGVGVANMIEAFIAGMTVVAPNSRVNVKVR